MASELSAALAAFQADMPHVGKGSTANAGTYSYQYADLAEINAVVLPLLGKHGLSFSSKPTIVDGRFVLAYVLRHSSGESDEGVYPLPDPTKSSAQQIGSSISYARRYAFCAVTGVAPGGEDDDGATAQPVNRERVERQEWDDAQQIDDEDLENGFNDEIANAKTPADVLKIGERVTAKREAKDLRPNTYTRLARTASARLAELQQEEEGRGDPNN